MLGVIGAAAAAAGNTAQSSSSYSKFQLAQVGAARCNPRRGLRAWHWDEGCTDGSSSGSSDNSGRMMAEHKTRLRMAQVAAKRKVFWAGSDLQGPALEGQQLLLAKYWSFLAVRSGACRSP
jgi:hypothetical protein